MKDETLSSETLAPINYNTWPHTLQDSRLRTNSRQNL